MHTLKKLFISAVMLACCTTNIMAQQEERVIVHLKDGKQAEYLMQEVEYIEIQTPKDENNNENENLAGTVANAVDLGLSVDWAEHNLGADHPTGFGGYWTITDEALSAWGEGWRLPTDEEWQELYDRCDWRWVVYNGVGCREISTKSGKIIIPAAGITLGESAYIKSGVGLYMTNTEAKADGTIGANIIGSYFDSANIYRMEFPKTNRFSVRLVKEKNYGYSR